MNYFVFTKEQSDGGQILWWRANRSGYTVDLGQAGLYSQSEAESISRIRGIDFAVPEDALGSVIQTKTVVDAGENYEALKLFQQTVRAA
jgi:hypothetical protein